jgi:hypothetical protein
MKSTYFCNKKSLQIVTPSIKNDIKNLINDIGSFNLTSKYYTFLNKKNVNNLKESNFLVSLSTFGKKFILFVTKYNTKKYCIFINKKNDTMTVTQLKFVDDIFLGTLFDGELIKNSNDKWIYLINDIAYYKGKNIVTKSFAERQNLIENILNNEYENESSLESQSLFISKKYYFEHKFIKDLVENYMNCLNYKCSGLYFKNINNFSDNYLFIFPECRSDSKILNNGSTIDNQKVIIDNKDNKDEEEDDEDDLFKDVEIIKNDVSQKQQQNKSSNNYKLEKTTCRFLIHSTLMPDIYELYCKNTNNNIEKYNYASVPDIETSNFLKNILGEKYDLNEDIHSKVENKNAIYVECNYHKSFKKWVPYKKVDSMDNINTINQIQIILDSL